MRTRTFACTLLSAFALLVAGCNGGSADAQDAVAWTDGVCGALTGFTTAATARPQFDRTDAAAAVRGVSDYLGSTSDALKRSITALEQVGRSPVEGGDEYVARLRDALVHIQGSFETSRTLLAGVDTSSRAAVTAALPTVIAPLQQLRDLPSPAEGLRANDALSTASEQAPNCQHLRSVSSPAS